MRTRTSWYRLCGMPRGGRHQRMQRIQQSTGLFVHRGKAASVSALTVAVQAPDLIALLDNKGNGRIDARRTQTNVLNFDSPIPAGFRSDSPIVTVSGLIQHKHGSQNMAGCNIGPVSDLMSQDRRAQLGIQAHASHAGGL